jgi:hypothetical protein
MDLSLLPSAVAAAGNMDLSLLPSAAAAAGNMELSLLPSSLPSAKGGRCLDGSMAGFYYRPGTADTFVIYLHGGGACYDEDSCVKRANSALGSSKHWSQTITGGAPGSAGDEIQSADCSVNPAFCNATAVYVPYCTGDTVRAPCVM